MPTRLPRLNLDDDDPDSTWIPTVTKSYEAGNTTKPMPVTVVVRPPLAVVVRPQLPDSWPPVARSRARA